MLDGRSVLVRRASGGWQAIVGIPLGQEAPGMLAVDIDQPGGDSRRIEIAVEPNNYAEQRLNVERKYVEPNSGTSGPVKRPVAPSRFDSSKRNRNSSFDRLL